jgi:hypothetical protein
MSAKVAVDLKLFEYVVTKNGPITATELAILSGAEELLIGEFHHELVRKQILSNYSVRVLRPLAATGFLKEVDEKTWTATPVSQAMAINEIAAGHRMM